MFESDDVGAEFVATHNVFKRSPAISSNVWLDRHVYSEIKGSLTSSTEPSVDGTGSYSETLYVFSGFFVVALVVSILMVINIKSIKKRKQKVHH